jgi:hypothetical protein
MPTLEMLENAAAAFGSGGALGRSDIVRIIRIYKGTRPPQNVLLVGPETPAEFSSASKVSARGHDTGRYCRRE